MTKFLISILSDHILPNYLFAKEIMGRYDCHIFIVTDYITSTKKTDILFEKALGLSRLSAARIIVDNDNYAAIYQKLSSFQFNNEDAYIVNLTGGTKAMCVAAHSFFQSFNSEFYYIPIGENKYYSFDSTKSVDINYRVNLREYLSLYGLTCITNNTYMYNPDKAKNLFSRQLRSAHPIKEIKNAQQAQTAELRRYYGGVWFEEYVYWRMKKDMNLQNNAIAKSVQVFRDSYDNTLHQDFVDRQANDNEIDILFVKDNILSYIECKVGMFGYGKPQDAVYQYLYKIAAVSKDLGLKVNSYLVTMHQMKFFKKTALDNIKKRIRILGINDIISREYFYSHPKIEL